MNKDSTNKLNNICDLLDLDTKYKWTPYLQETMNILKKIMSDITYMTEIG